jgi:hypothetical protein
MGSDSVSDSEVLLLVLRIFGEEKLFARDLEGYQEYLENVSYRLVPHIWQTNRQLISALDKTSIEVSDALGGWPANQKLSRNGFEEIGALAMANCIVLPRSGLLARDNYRLAGDPDTIAET